jgi:predicted transposase/invertase (TIGR01784 family)
MQEEKRYISLSNDLVFKYILGTEENKKFAMDFISSILNIKKNEKIEIQNSIKLSKEVVESKQFEVDVLIRTKKKIINLEMQNIYNKNSLIRNLTYMMSIFIREFKRGRKYEDIIPIIQINIIKTNEVYKNERKLIEKFSINNIETKHKLLARYFRIIIIDLKKSEIEVNDRLKGWLILLNATNKEEERKSIKYNNLMEEVIEKMEKFRENEYVQNYEREEALFRSNKSLWKKEGREEGITVGKEKGKREAYYDTARKLIIRGMDEREINDITSVPIEKIKEFKLELKETSAKYGEEVSSEK